jgi:hypothetical protein
MHSSLSQCNFLVTIMTVERLTYHVAASLRTTGKTGSTKSPGEGIQIPQYCLRILPADHSGRLAVIYRILNKLIFFGPAAMCNMPSEFMIAPLPAKRQLWEATDAQEWTLQSQREPREQVSYALAAEGEIVKLDQGRLSCRDAWLPYLPPDQETPQLHGSRTNPSAGLWAEWCSGMDSMGGLIMLAASIA